MRLLPAVAAIVFLLPIQTFAAIPAKDIELKSLVGSIAVGDMGTDGTPELIIGAPYGTEPRIRSLRQDQSEIKNFLAFDKTETGGVNVAVCDIDHDGKNEVIAALRFGPSLVSVFDSMGKKISGVAAYTDSFSGGVNLTCGELDSEPGDELITLPGQGGGPHVKQWTLKDGSLTLVRQWFASDPGDTRGLVGSIADGRLYVSTESAGAISTGIYAASGEKTGGFEFVSEAAGISSVAFANGQPILFTYGSSSPIGFDGAPPEGLEKGQGKKVATADLDQNGSAELVSGYTPSLFLSGSAPKSIRVDLSEQRLYAFENGILANSFLISSGKSPFSTPVGETKVLAKLPVVNYRWSYGLNDPRNYDLGPVPYNLRIYNHIYIHYAYWHNNFGHPMSHGCVNVNKANMKWVYDWADEEIPVTIAN